MAGVLVSTLIIALASRLVSSQQGTTQNLKDIVEGRCLDFGISRGGGLLPPTDINCTALWIRFTESWTFNTPCKNATVNYDHVIRLANQTLPKDKSLFWSGTKDFAHELSRQGQRYVTLEDTLIGFIADRLFWCGQTSPPGINFENCPSYGSCPAESVSSFWTAASKWFATKANGNIFVVLNGSNPTRPAYNRDSTFGSVELPNLQTHLVNKITAIVVHDVGKPVKETCGKGSLLNLESDVYARNIDFKCVENPLQVRYLLCTDSADRPECDLSPSPCGHNSAGHLSFILAAHGRHVGVLLVILASFLMNISI